MQQFKLDNRRYLTSKEHNGQTASAGQLWAGFIEKQDSKLLEKTKIQE